MQLLTVLPDVLSFVVTLVDETPKPEDVKAGWMAFAIFIGLGVAVALLGFSLVRQLRKAQAAQEAGVYDSKDDKADAADAGDAGGAGGAGGAGDNVED